jgi:PHD/YefM family antitoxin component YafN of YafNO toxin-antitoxin module
MKGTVLNTVPAQEVKRRGVGAIVERLKQGPVHVLQRNQPAFVALDEETFRALLAEVEEARLRESLLDLQEGRVRHAGADEIFDELVD